MINGIVSQQSLIVKWEPENLNSACDLFAYFTLFFLA